MLVCIMSEFKFIFFSSTNLFTAKSFLSSVLSIISFCTMFSISLADLEQAGK